MVCSTPELGKASRLYVEMDRPTLPPSTLQANTGAALSRVDFLEVVEKGASFQNEAQIGV